MQYLNYERDIVLRHGVVLEGWTHSTWANPSELSTSLEPLRRLLDALKNDTCKFVKLTTAQRQKRQEEYNKKVDSGEIQVQERQKRKDAGKKRKQHDGGGVTDDDINDNPAQGNGDQDGDDQGNDRPSVQAKRGRKAKKSRTHRQEDEENSRPLAKKHRRSLKKSAPVVNDSN
jgi:hypothetical protein